MLSIMKNYIKYAVVGAAFVLSLAFGVTAHAAPQFGAGSSPYLPLVQVQGCGANNGCSPSPSAYSSSISNVQPGDTIWVMLYYNNNGTGTATNTRFTLSPQTTGSVSSQTFSATLSADNANTVSGSATVNLAQSQTLTYLGAKVYKHNAVLASTTYGTELFSGGLNIGNALDNTGCPSSDAFCNQGVVVVTYKVGQNTVVPPPTQTCQITQFNASPSYVTSGGSSTINWATSGCASAIVQGGIVYVNSLSGSQNTGSLYGTTTYTITAYGYNGSPVTQSTSVSVGNNQSNSCYVNYFSANPTFVSYGGTSSLSWNTTGCSYVTLSGPNVYGSNQSVSGSLSTGPVYGSVSYILTAYGYNGQSAPSQTVTVYSNGNNYNYCSINSFYASPSVVTAGNSATLYWTTTGATSISISGLNNYYNQPLSGSASTGPVYGNQTYTLTAYCQNGGQTQVQAVTVSTSQPAQNTSVYTSAPTLVTQSTARLNGNLALSGGLNTQVYFQWGTTSAYGFTTNQQNAGSGSSVPFWTTISGLSPNTTYYYRAVAVNSSGTYYGDQQSFSTSPVTTVVTPPTTVVVTSGVGSGSNLVSLDVNNNQPMNACVGNMINYLVTYKNISGRTLNNVVLQVRLPQDVEFQGSNPGIYNAADHTVTLSVGTLLKNQAGTMNITGVVLRSALNRNLVVAEATIAFTNPVNNSQESATAYGLGNTTNCVNNSLAGLALWGNGFWPNTLIGWLILILVILLLIYLAILVGRSLRRDNNTNVYVANGAAPKQGNGRTASHQPHYEDMDVPVYNSNHH